MELVSTEKKYLKKHNRCKKIMENTTGILSSDTPTRHIAICNSGLSNGMSEETLVEHFMPFGQIEKISMIPGSSCCFLTFTSICSGINAYNSINGKLNIAQDKKPVYLAFTESIPSQNYNISTDLPQGLIVIENFVSELEETALLGLLRFSDNSELKHRLVKHYGYEFRYDINNVNKNSPLNENIPNECNFLWDRLLDNHKINFAPDQLTINYYRVGNGIPPHIDTHSAFEDPIISLSLGSSVVMDFRRSADHRSVFLPRRSLAIISGDSRYCWTHGITPRTLDIIRTENGLGLTTFQRETRTSFTFRKVKNGDCACPYHDSCDSFKERQIQIPDTVAAKLESSHVHDVYENIAEHFSDTRHKPWPGVQDFVKSLDMGSILVDVGCGNGKYLGENKSIFNLGCDRSQRLLDVCQQRNFNVFHCNCLQIPLRDGIANGLICIAVIHHLSTWQRRLQSITEIVRVLTVKGRALIYVWAKDQCNDNCKSSYLMQDRKNRKSSAAVVTDQSAKVHVKVMVESDSLTLPIHTNRRQFGHADVLVPWKLKMELEEAPNEFLRFYHVFVEGELESLCKLLDNVTVCKSYYEQGNWCIILEKNK